MVTMPLHFASIVEEAVHASQTNERNAAQALWRQACSVGLLRPPDGESSRRDSILYSLELGKHGLLDLPFWMQRDVIPRLVDFTDSWTLPHFGDLRDGQNVVLGIGLSEAHSASSFTRLTCTAAYDPNREQYAIEGEKRHVTNACIADAIVISARVHRDNQTRVGLFLVDSRLPGVAIEPTPLGDGLELLATGTVQLTNVLVPATHLLGGSPNAVVQLAAPMAVERLMLGNMARAAASVAVDQLSERMTSGKGGNFKASSDRATTLLSELCARGMAVDAFGQVLADDYIHGRLLSAERAAAYKVLSISYLIDALQVLIRLRTASEMEAESQIPARLSLDARLRAAIAQGLAGGTEHALSRLIISSANPKKTH